MSARSLQPLALAPTLADWLSQAADGIDTGGEPAANVLPQLAQGGLIGAGVPVANGGVGGDALDGVAAISAVAEHSLAAAFVLWSQRTYVEYLLQSSNAVLRERHLPDLLAGRVAGATGLSNAMKYLAGLEPLQIVARADGEALVLEGKLPWVTNLRPEGFHVAAAVDRADGWSAFVVSLAHDDEGLERSADLDLVAMRSSNTAAVTLSGARVDRDRILADNAGEWLPRVRPAFIGLQCGMSIGLARRALVLASPVAFRLPRLHLGDRQRKKILRHRACRELLAQEGGRDALGARFGKQLRHETRFRLVGSGRPAVAKCPAAPSSVEAIAMPKGTVLPDPVRAETSMSASPWSPSGQHLAAAVPRLYS